MMDGLKYGAYDSGVFIDFIPNNKVWRKAPRSQMLSYALFTAHTVPSHDR